MYNVPLFSTRIFKNQPYDVYLRLIFSYEWVVFRDRTTSYFVLQEGCKCVFCLQKLFKKQAFQGL